MKVDFENRLHALGGLHDIWRWLENSREYGSTNAAQYITSAQKEIDKAIVATSQEIVELHRQTEVEEFYDETVD